MKKRFCLIIITVMLLTGCVAVDKADIDTLIDSTSKSKYELYNHVNSGYKYYLPRELTSMVTDEYTEVIKGKNNDYYLYVDLVAYFNKKQSILEEDTSIYYSRIFKKDDSEGIVNIKEKDGAYIIRVYFNYAKVEVKCKKKDINEAVTNALIIVNSVNYNDDIIKHLLSKSEFEGVEEQINIFDKSQVDDDSLNIEENVYDGNEEEDYDPDVINRRG